ncbi:MAG TPA: LacI family DNA-binding transcriptional regulator [Candidatus Avipropionibacterium avicola]|uniref:LacI family DNA-binding transcriptional regulator n=1 Tax=Candidatus Avipropionibacterium avicola TaxID=2840701 RepID=A0A9D1H0A3_9ACTN|nr:LacI family DNA-binding transcriptional regulator [Candidatus Avipropionibacterium avicola]
MQQEGHHASSTQDITIYSLAAELGLSPSTVSRAFSRPDLVRESVRERILDLATQKGYAPSRLARSLATGRTGLIGLLVGDITNPFFPPLVRAVEHATNVLDSAVLLVDARSGGRPEHELIRRVVQNVDGMIMASPWARTPDLRAAIGKTPTVLINRVVQGLASVTCHAIGAHLEAAEHLVELGHRRILLDRGPSESWVAQRRSSALRRWAEARPGIELIEGRRRQSGYLRGRNRVGEMLETGATAIMAIDDYTAAGIIDGLAEVGVSVPEDISVVGCDDVLMSQVMTPQLTTITVPGPELGNAAVGLLSQLMASTPVENVTMDAELQVRGTTGPAPRRRGGRRR